MSNKADTRVKTRVTNVQKPSPIEFSSDPVARLALKLFGQRLGLLFLLVAVGGAVVIYLPSAIDGTLLPRPGFDAALSDVNSAIIWIFLIPVAAVIYVLQLRDIPRLFFELYENRVTGLTVTQYERFAEDASRQFGQWYWTAFAALLFALPWSYFMQATAAAPHTWYYPSTLWPWLLFNAIQYFEIYCVIQYAFRYWITCVQLRKLLRPGLPRPHWLYQGQFQRPAEPVEPRFLHPDGLGGFGVVITYTIRSLILGGGVLVVITLESVNTARTVPHLGQSSGLVSFIIAAVLYATVVPLLLLYPIRLTLAEIRNAKTWLAQRISQHESGVIWHRIKQMEHADSAARDEHVEVVVHSIRPLTDIKTALDTVPESLVQVGQRSRLIVLASVTPSLVSILYRVGTDLWGWNLDALVRTILTGH